MEPFVPEPDERISHNSGKAPKPHSEPSNANGAKQPSSGGKFPVNVLTTGVFIVLLGAVYFVQQSNINQLEDKLSAVSNAEAGPSPEPDKNAPTLKNQVTALTQLVDSQVIEIHNLKQAIENQGPATNTPAAGAVTSIPDLDQLKKQIAEIRSSIAAMPSPTSAASLGEASSRLRIAIDQAFKTQSGAIEYQAAQINALEQQLINGLSQATSTIEQKVSGLSSELSDRLNNFSSQVDTKIGSSEEKLSALVAQSIDTSAGKTANQLAQYQEALNDLQSQVEINAQAQGSGVDPAELTALFSPLESQIEPLKQKVESLSANLDKTRSAIAPLEARVNDLASFTDQTRSSLKPLNSELDQVAAAVSQTESSLSQLRSELDRRLSSLNEAPASSKVDSTELVALEKRVQSQLNQLNELKAKDKELSSQISSTSRQLKAIETSVAALERTGGGVSVASAAPVDVDALQSEIASLESKANSTLSRIRANESQLISWQRKVESQLNAVRSAPASTAGLSAEDRETIRLLKKQHPYTDFPGED